MQQNLFLHQGNNGNTSLRYLEFREGAFDFQTSQQNQVTYVEIHNDWSTKFKEKSFETVPSVTMHDWLRK